MADLADVISAAVQKNRGIPAMLDAYGEFAVSPIGPLELQSLEEVFSRIENNLLQRFPEVASKRAASAARNDILSFLSVSGNSPERVRQLLRAELIRSASALMGQSIAERLARMNPDERRAIDATLRLIRRAPMEILFRVEAGKSLASAGREYERFFAAVRAEAPQMRELRYENLIVEKGIFDKLLLKSSSERENYSIWVPSLFARDNADMLIQRVGLPSDHILLGRLRESFAAGVPQDVQGLLETLVDNQGVLSRPSPVPEIIADFVQTEGNYVVVNPIELDDIATFLAEERKKQESSQRAEEERLRAKQAEEDARREEESQARKKRTRPQVVTATPRAAVEEQQQRQQTNAAGTAQTLAPESEQEGQIYLGKKLDLQAFLGAIARRTPEDQIPSVVRAIGDFRLGEDVVRSRGVTIVGSSGSGRSTSLRRILDGLGALPSQQVVVIDQKGEHRGLAWKYGWDVLGFSKDSQAREFRISFIPRGVPIDVASEFVAELIQEWFLQGGMNCTDQQTARVASLTRALVRSGEATLESVVRAIGQDQDLSALGQKLAKNFTSRATASRIFYLAEQRKNDGTDELFGEKRSKLFDISGRGLRDPTTKEERQLLSVLLLQEMLSSDKLSSAIIVLEDFLDRFKSAALRKRVAEIMQELRARGNSFVVTSRTQARDFVGDQGLEVLHRLSGEKAVSEELRGFRSDIPVKTLASVVGYLPRGYAITSQFEMREGSVRASSAVRVETLQFGGSA